MIPNYGDYLPSLLTLPERTFMNEPIGSFTCQTIMTSILCDKSGISLSLISRGECIERMNLILTSPDAHHDISNRAKIIITHIFDEKNARSILIEAIID